MKLDEIKNKIQEMQQNDKYYARIQVGDKQFINVDLDTDIDFYRKEVIFNTDYGKIVVFTDKIKRII
ncbi:MAG: hypothetical protein E7H33_09650 [Clostridium perfringens]|nr:hypothetical protein [Clostridium perfringens]